MIDALLTVMATAGQAIRFEDLGLTTESKIALDLGFFQLRWYSLAYLFGIILGWWYLLRLLREPGAPMARRHADDMVFFATLGIIIGGRLGYVLFYRPAFYFNDPLEILQLWDGGMSFHGGVIGVSLGIMWMARKHNLDWLRIHDYVACCIPFGLFLGRLANFVNAELWGRQSNLPWAIVFPNAGGVPRHPSQLYEAILEGIVLFLVLWLMFWKTKARWQRGKLVGAFILVYGISRFLVELVRQPDAGLEHLAWGLSMGQTLSLPMILGGLYLILTARQRSERSPPAASLESAG